MKPQASNSILSQPQSENPSLFLLSPNPPPPPLAFGQIRGQEANAWSKDQYELHQLPLHNLLVTSDRVEVGQCAVSPQFACWLGQIHSNCERWSYRSRWGNSCLGWSQGHASITKSGKAGRDATGTWNAGLDHYSAWYSTVRGTKLSSNWFTDQKVGLILIIIPMLKKHR